jgi:hypothetical protein
MSDDPTDRVVVKQRTHAWDAAERLSIQYPSVERDYIIALLIDARRSTDLAGLSLGDELEIAERLAVDQLEGRVARPPAQAV